MLVPRPKHAVLLLADKATPTEANNTGLWYNTPKVTPNEVDSL